MVLNRSRSSERVDILERDLGPAGTKTATDVTATELRLWGSRSVGEQLSTLHKYYSNREFQWILTNRSFRYLAYVIPRLTLPYYCG